MPPKRKRTGDDYAPQELVTKPAAGTKSFTSGKAIKDALASGSRQSIISFHQQITTPYSSLPLAINHPTVLILQHYLAVSPVLDEIFSAWQQGNQAKNDKQVDAAVSLLAEIIKILTPLPFFHTSLVGVVNKLVAPTENYHDLLNRLIQSGKREQSLVGLQLAAAAANVDPPSPVPSSSTSGRGALKVLATLVDGGSLKGMGKLLNMRRRNKEGEVEYGSRDPLDKPDIRHLALSLILSLLPASAFQSHAKTILPPIFSNLSADPPLTVLRVLNAVYSAISHPSQGAARRTALSLLDENAIEQISKLLARDDTEETTGRSISDIAGAFLKAVTATPGKGICFPDEGWYPRKMDRGDFILVVDAEEEEGAGVGDGKDGKHRKGLHNRILANVVRHLGGKVVEDEGRLGGWVLKVFNACPELVAGYWPHSALSLEPRLNAKWMATMAFIGKIVSLPLPPSSSFRQPLPRNTDNSYVAPPRTNPPLLQTMVESIIPSPLTKNFLTRGLEHTDSLVQHITALTLAKTLQKLSKVQQYFQQIEAEIDSEPSTSSENPWTRRRRELEMETRKRVPDLWVIITFAQKAAQLAPTEPESDEDFSKLTRSNILTESALRLFGLYHKTLPSLAGETKFDIGKLLVSSSSASAERRARREAREGSVISDSGSVGSVGTLGTVGMGGGFGQGRGAVQGFEALSQLHVLKLLSEVEDWSWTNKAAGSQYTYLYHILQLHLSTLHTITFETTSNLLDRLLSKSILFEHDPSELSIWLTAMPRTTTKTSGPALLVQQIHLLSFIDDCVRRAMKTPYRYIEDLQSLSTASGHSVNVQDKDKISPVMMTVLEQFHAKIMGQHIATEAAGVVLAYLRRVMLGLCGKQGDVGVLEAVVERLEKTLASSKDAGQARIGLAESVDAIKGDLRIILGGTENTGYEGGKNNGEVQIMKLVDESEWSEKSFESLCLSMTIDDWESPTSVQSLSKLIESQPSSEIITRQGRFLLHILASQKDVQKYYKALENILGLLRSCLARGIPDLKNHVFDDETIKSLYLSKLGDENRTQLEDLASILSKDGPDPALAENYVHQTVERIQESSKISALETILTRSRPWIRFFDIKQAKSSLTHITDLLNRKAPKNLSPTTVFAISDLIRQTSDAVFAVELLPTLLPYKIILPFIQLLGTSQTTPTTTMVVVDKGVINQLVNSDDDVSFILLTSLVDHFPKARESLRSIINDDPIILENRRILSTLKLLLDTSSSSSTSLQPRQMTQSATQALVDRSLASSVHESATRILVSIASTQPDIVVATISSLQIGDFGVPLIKAAERLGRVQDVEAVIAVGHIVDLGLQAVVRICSSDVPLSETDLQIMRTLASTIRIANTLDLKAHLVEPVITAVVQERMEVVEPMELAALLTSRTMLKAGFIRQNLQLIFSTASYTRQTRPTIPSNLRKAFTSLLHALFLASTYVSCQPAFIESLLPLYRGTLSRADQLILSLFQVFETNRKLSVGSVLKHWSTSGQGGEAGRAFDALTSLDPQKVFVTCTSFPLRRSWATIGLIAVGVRDEIDDENFYDPVFVLALVGFTLNEGSLSGLDWVEILRSNVLGIAICALSSRDEDMRAMGSYVLAKTIALISTTAFQERPQLLYTLRVLRHSIPTSTQSTTDSKPEKIPRLPTIATLFFAHTLRALAHPAHYIYPHLSRHLLQRHTFDLFDVPTLYTLLYASGEGWRKERSWILRLLRDGVRSEADWRVLRRRHVWELVAGMYQGSLDSSFRRLVLQVMTSMTQIPTGARSLIYHSSIIPWLIMQWDLSLAHPTRSSEEERSTYLALLENVIINCTTAHGGLSNKKVAGEMDDDEVPAKKVKESQMRWLGDVEVLLRLACISADTERLETLSRILFRISTLPNSSSTVIALLPKFVIAFNKLPESSMKTIEYLFRAGLALTDSLTFGQEVKEALRGIKDRIARTDGEVGDWARKQIRAGVGV